MNRRSFLKTTAATTALLATARGWSAEQAIPAPSDDEVLVQAKDRIAKHRQGDGIVTVRGADGKPIPGATVKVEQLGHDFLFGCNVFMFARFRETEREEEYRRRFAALLNYATLGFYWGAYEPERGVIRSLGKQPFSLGRPVRVVLRLHPFCVGVARGWFTS